MIYNKEIGGKQNVLILPGCEAYVDSTGGCPLEIWSQLTESVSPDMDTWYAECNDVSSFTYSYSIFDAAFVVFICMIVLADFYYIHIYYSRSNKHGYEKI